MSVGSVSRFIVWMSMSNTSLCLKDCFCQRSVDYLCGPISGLYICSMDLYGHEILRNTVQPSWIEFGGINWMLTESRGNSIIGYFVGGTVTSFACL